jgi:hypothetical protein
MISMVTYGDYFPRRVLHYCGVSPDQKLFKNDEMAYTGSQRTDKIRSEIAEIYQTLYRGHTENNVGKAKGDFADFQVERRVVSALYDSGILSAAERDYFQTQAAQGRDEREQICVEEANTVMTTAKAQKVDPQVKTLSARNVRQ